MATTPQPPHKPAPPPPLKDPAAGKSPAIGGGHLTKTGDDKSAADDRPTIGVRGEAIEDGSRDPGTIAEEQRARSAEIEGMGVEAWKAAHDDRTPEHERLEHHKAP